MKRNRAVSVDDEQAAKAFALDTSVENQCGREAPNDKYQNNKDDRDQTLIVSLTDVNNESDPRRRPPPSLSTTRTHKRSRNDILEDDDVNEQRKRKHDDSEVNQDDDAERLPSPRKKVKDVDPPQSTDRPSVAPAASLKGTSSLTPIDVVVAEADDERIEEGSAADDNDTEEEDRPYLFVNETSESIQSISYSSDARNVVQKRLVPLSSSELEHPVAPPVKEGSDATTKTTSDPKCERHHPKVNTSVEPDGLNNLSLDQCEEGEGGGDKGDDGGDSVNDDVDLTEAGIGKTVLTDSLLKPEPGVRRHSSHLRSFLLLIVISMFLTVGIMLLLPGQQIQQRQRRPSPPSSNQTLTLREYLQDERGYHLGMAPAFFGFYAYFGALSVLEEEGLLLQLGRVAGASAGAMAAATLGVGIGPQEAAQHVCDPAYLAIKGFADVPRWWGGPALFHGARFEGLMRDFLRNRTFEDAVIPVAVTAFDLQSLSGVAVASSSSFPDVDLAKATRASSTFPGLFQPLVVDGTKSDAETMSTKDRTSQQKRRGLWVDGGIWDPHGLQGLWADGFAASEEPSQQSRSRRVVNLAVGGGGTYDRVPVPSDFEGVDTLVSVYLRGTPQCGPWAMSNGPRAVEAAHRAMKAALDRPMSPGREKGHYELSIDAAS